MARGLSAALIVVAFWLPGCGPSYHAQVPSSDRAGSEATCTALIERLQSERLPALVSATPWENLYGPGLRLTTDHYEIFSTVTQPLLLRMVPGFVESAHRGYNEQLPHAIETATPLQVYLFADRRQWEDFTNDFAGDQAPLFLKIRTGAYYLNGACVVYDIGPTRTLAALGHEGWHQFNSRHFKYRLPSWLDEGVAMQFETGVSERGLYRFDPSANLQRLGALQETLGRGQPIPLRDLVATSPGEVLATDQAQAVTAFYSQSYAVVRFLREAGGGRHLDSYHRLLADGLLGRWPLDPAAGLTAADRNLPRTIIWNRQVGRQLFEHYIGADLDRLEQDYLAFCHRLTRGLVVARE
ncbi:MAG: hypothetical protein MUC88_11415 [Planctomycetes bacterium]|jgi:hypothetical protein|nr:hypothetical protein [Planctomycetota bacterium]